MKYKVGESHKDLPIGQIRRWPQNINNEEDSLFEIVGYSGFLDRIRINCIDGTTSDCELPANIILNKSYVEIGYKKAKEFESDLKDLINE